MDEIKLRENYENILRDNREIVASMRNPALTRYVRYAKLGGIALLIPIFFYLWVPTDETLSGRALIVIIIPWIFAALLGAITDLLLRAPTIFMRLYFVVLFVRTGSLVDFFGVDVPDKQKLNHFNEINDKIQTQRSKVERLKPWVTWMERLTFLFLCVAFLWSVIYALILIMG